MAGAAEKMANLHKALVLENLVKEVSAADNPFDLVMTNFIPLKQEKETELENTVFLLKKSDVTEGAGKLFLNQCNQSADVLEVLNVLANETVPVSVELEGWNSALKVEISLLVHFRATTGDFEKAIFDIMENVGIFNNHQTIIWGTDPKLDRTERFPTIKRMEYFGMKDKTAVTEEEIKKKWSAMKNQKDKTLER